jgi:hypothetical protein
VHGTPAWVTVNVFPPAVIVPVRQELPGFAATLRLIVPEPAPLAPAVIVIQAALLLAVQSQPAAAVNVTAAVPPAAETN